MRKKITHFIFIFSIIILASSHFVYAGSSMTEDNLSSPAVDVRNEKSAVNPLKGPNDHLRDGSFVLETDEQSASDSLNRISGNIDTGFSAPENSYESQEHAGAGPFEKEKTEMRKQASQAY